MKKRRVEKRVLRFLFFLCSHSKHFRCVRKGTRTRSQLSTRHAQTRASRVKKHGTKKELPPPPLFYFRMTDAAAEAALVETYTAQLAALKGLLADKHFRGRDLADKG